MSETNLFSSVVPIIRMMLIGKLFDGSNAEPVEPKLSPSGRLERELNKSEVFISSSRRDLSISFSAKMIPA